MKILIIEDDYQVAETLKLLFSSQAYALDTAADGATGQQMLKIYDYDLVILDILLPDIDGIRLCKDLRANGYSFPILLLTGLGDSHEKAAGLNAGADDYVAKPFDSEELLARVQAILRRQSSIKSSILSWSSLTLDVTCFEAAYCGQVLPLTPKEFAILEMFLRNPQRVFSAKTIVDQAWPSEEAPGEEVVRVHIKGLRQKLKAAGASPELIETVHRVGYRLNPAFGPEAAAAAAEDAPCADITVAMVSPNADMFQRVAGLLDAQPLYLSWQERAEDLWSVLETTPLGLVIIDAEALGLAGIDLCRRLRQAPQGRALPVLVLLAADWAEGIPQAFDAGASDIVQQPIVGPELVNRVVNWAGQSNEHSTPSGLGLAGSRLAKSQ